MQECRERIYQREEELISYHNRVNKAAEDAMYKGTSIKDRPAKPTHIEPPILKSGFLMFFIKLMNIKTTLAKYNYLQYWDKWNFLDLIDTAYIITTREIEV